nr:malto-oligosyltrehalose trehalohydrolase [Propionibacterium sp.]
MADPLIPVEVWAPRASSLNAVLADGRRVPLTRVPDRDGLWRTRLPAGTDYRLSVDGGAPYPDPRSRWQPAGVHGPSRVFDPAAHIWADTDWPGVDVLGKVFYELHVGTFTPEGTLDAAAARLPHLAALGVDLVELMPLAAFDGARGWGYDGVDLYAVHEAYGGPAALQRFVDAAHAHGLGVCLDVVYNHFGPAGNYWSHFGPYLTSKHTTPWGDAMNLDDEGSEGVRAFIIDNALAWIEDFHVDALRLDAIHALVDESTEPLVAQLAAAVHALGARLGRPASVTAESDLNDARLVAPPPAGDGVDAQWDDDVHHALHSYLTGETVGYYADFGSPETLAKALTRVFVHDGTFSSFRGTTWGRPVGDDVDRRRFIVSTQNHDQVGNRGLGDRPDATLAAGTVAGGAALLLLGPYTPMLFMGQEWGTRTPFLFFTDHADELGERIRRGRAAEFARHGWAELYGPGLQVPDPQPPATFAASTLDWTEPGRPEHAAVLAWHRRLIALRRQHLAGGGHPIRCDHGEGWFRMVHGPLTVLLAPHDRRVAVAEPRRRVLASFGDVVTGADGVRLGPQAVVVLAEGPG